MSKLNDSAHATRSTVLPVYPGSVPVYPGSVKKSLRAQIGSGSVYLAVCTDTTIRDIARAGSNPAGCWGWDNGPATNVFGAISSGPAVVMRATLPTIVEMAAATRRD